MSVWAAPGARETIPEGGGRSPSPFGRVSGAPGLAQTPKMMKFSRLQTQIRLPEPGPIASETSVARLAQTAWLGTAVDPGSEVASIEHTEIPTEGDWVCFWCMWFRA